MTQQSALTKSFSPTLSYLLLLLSIIIFDIYVFKISLQTGPYIKPGLYRHVYSPIQIGDYLEICLPADIAKTGLNLNYLKTGTCIGGAAPWIGKVAAIYGNVVHTDVKAVTIENNDLPHSARLTSNGNGQAIPAIANGEYILKANDLWLASYATDASKEWDSRYFGPIYNGTVLKIYRPLFNFEPRLFGN